MDMYDALEVSDVVVYSDRDLEIIGVWTRGSRIVNFYAPAEDSLWETIDVMTLGGDANPTLEEIIMRASAFILNEG